MRKYVLMPDAVMTPELWARVQAILPDLPVRDRALIRFLAASGLRREEASCMNVDDVHLDCASPWLDVIGKGDKRRVVHLSAAAAEALRQVVELRRSGPVWLSAKRNLYDGRWTAGAMQRMFAAVGARLGVRLHLHQLRHLYGSVRVHVTGNVATTAKEMGHSNLETTMQYVDVWGNQAKRDAEAVARFLGLANDKPEEAANGTI